MNCQNLEQDGVIERFYCFDSARPTARKTKHARLRLVAHPAARFRRSQNMADLIRLLEELGGAAPLFVVKERIKNAGYWIEKLVKLGCIEIEAPAEPTSSECRSFCRGLLHPSLPLISKGFGRHPTENSGAFF